MLIGDEKYVTQPFEAGKLESKVAQWLPKETVVSASGVPVRVDVWR
jgi:hypothetical protein